MNDQVLIRRLNDRRRGTTPLIDAWRFFAAWLRNPRGIAAIAPSGRALAALIIRDVPRTAARVLELGPGTGVFTTALVDQGMPEHALTLIESDPSFARLLHQRYAKATVRQGDAATLKLREAHEPMFDAAVCGLGLLSMRDDTVQAILRNAFAAMRPGAPLFLFTYGPRCPVSEVVRQTLCLTAERIGTAWLNLPPAAVYRLSCDSTTRRRSQ